MNANLVALELDPLTLVVRDRHSREASQPLFASESARDPMTTHDAPNFRERASTPVSSKIIGGAGSHWTAFGAEPDNRQYAEALSAVLMPEMARVERASPEQAKPVRGGLSVRQQKRVIEFIEEHLAEDISLAMLAQLVNLSLCHFARVFKQSFGAPPHRYHMARRIDRATNLLHRSALSVTQIGIQIGFQESSSFTRAYRKFTGLTPSAYRRRG
jgi:AraC-like DNA-binding protein